jgi:sporulation protein YlmC with PRC-barrel domain
MTTEMTDVYEWQGRNMVGSDGEKIGKITDIYVLSAVEVGHRRGCQRRSSW